MKAKSTGLTELKWLVCPGWCGSVDWSIVPCTKRLGFDYWSGLIPRLWVWSSPLHVWEAIDRCFSLMLMSLSLFPLSFSLKSISIFKKVTGSVYTVWAFLPTCWTQSWAGKLTQTGSMQPAWRLCLKVLKPSHDHFYRTPGVYTSYFPTNKKQE